MTLAAALLAGLAGCDETGTAQIQRLKADIRRGDPPALWSIEVAGQRPGDPPLGRPVLICANRQIVSGFFSIVPAVGGEDCRRLARELTPTGNGFRYRCRLKGVDYAVSSVIAGDAHRDFTVASSAYPILEDGPEYSRSLRFRRQGGCPPGWRVGEATNQKGERTQAIDPDSL
jgi:hypothetical protein